MAFGSRELRKELGKLDKDWRDGNQIGTGLLDIGQPYSTLNAYLKSGLSGVLSSTAFYISYKVYAAADFSDPAVANILLPLALIPFAIGIISAYASIYLIGYGRKFARLEREFGKENIRLALSSE